GRDPFGFVPYAHLYIEAGDAVGQGGEVLRAHLRLDLLRLGRAVDALEARHGRSGEGGVVHGGQVALADPAQGRGEPVGGGHARDRALDPFLHLAPDVRV